jgi:putative SOS response-associated peptidase YedK
VIERYTLTSLDGIAATFGMAVPEDSAPRFNIGPLQIAPIGLASGIVPARWGLLPPWRGHGGKRGPHVLHAPVDAIDRTPLLRNAFRSQRCLVLADGFFVWRRAGKKSQPLWVHPAADPTEPRARSRATAFAGLATTHRDDGQLSFAIVVGPASPHVASLVGPDEPTAPVVIAAEDSRAWLAGPAERARELLARPPSGWRAEAVSTWVNAVEHDDAKCVEPLGNPAQGELF